MKIVLASNNKGKLREFARILAPLGIEMLSQREAGLDLEVEETGTTFAENSLLKAEAACKASGMIALADDSGIAVDALDGAPGVYSARYGTPDLDDEGRMFLLLKNMEGRENRACRYVDALTCVFPDGRILRAEGICEGELGYEPVGQNGFGYDPIFIIPGTGRTFAQFSDEEKDAISHRGKAIREMAKLLENI